MLSSQQLACINYSNPQNNLWGSGIITIPLSQRQENRHTDIQYFAQSHSARKWQSQDSSPASLARSLCPYHWPHTRLMLLLWTGDSLMAGASALRTWPQSIQAAVTKHHRQSGFKTIEMVLRASSPRPGFLWSCIRALLSGRLLVSSHHGSAELALGSLLHEGSALMTSPPPSVPTS